MTDHDLTALAAEMRTAIDREFPAALEDLKALCRIPSIAFAGFDRSPVDESAEAVAELLRGAGMPEVRILDAGGAPAVVAHRPGPEGSPTVLLYAHHDVQPVGDGSDWTTPPFEPEVRGERLFGRGAADDKAGIMAHVAALRMVGDRLGCGVKLFVEGEEEAGSPTFRPFLERYADVLRADTIVVADSSNWKVGVPALTTSLRGVVAAEVSVRALDHAVHSGMYGGPVLDALTLLSRLVATLHDENGEVAVPGLVVGAEPEVDMTEDDVRRDTSAVGTLRLAGSGSLTGRMWTKPALAVLGIDAPSVAAASNTIVPAARAKLSLRIAPGQDPQAAFDALEAHLLAHAPFGAEVDVRCLELGKPFSAGADTPAMRTARSAFEAAWGTAPVDTGIGGSIPFTADLREVFPDAEILITGVEDPDSRAHGADESLHLGEWRNVCVAEALLLLTLGR